jgi:hypothetical protein
MKDECHFKELEKEIDKAIKSSNERLEKIISEIESSNNVYETNR